MRPPEGTWFGDPTRGSFLTTVWVLEGCQPEWDAWVGRQMDDLRAQPDRMFAGRDHLRTAVYRFEHELRTGTGVSAATALDHPFAGVIMLAVNARSGPAVMRSVIGPEIPTAAVFAPERILMAEGDAPPPYELVLGFTVGDPIAAWHARVGPMLASLPRHRIREPVHPYYPRHGRLRRGDMNRKLYIHEFIDIIGHNRARYMHHMTANWCPVGKRERNMSCFGVWATVGSTGAWPQVVNLWELNGWKGLAANFEHELVGGGAQDPSFAEWWAAAAELRRGGTDRIVAPERWSPTIDELTKAGVKGEVYAHEMVRTPGRRRARVPRRAGRDRSARDRGTRPALCRRVPGRDGDRQRSDRDLGAARPQHLGCVRTGVGSRRAGAMAASTGRARLPTCIAR